MSFTQPISKQRKRAPSQRSLETKERVFNAAEELFAALGFEGASIRKIATLANVPTALVNHHGGSKEQLYAGIIARRAEQLSQMRLEALAASKRIGPVTLRGVLKAFLFPLLESAEAHKQWRAYARLIAQISADQRWQPITEEFIDPTARIFIAEFAALFPDAAKTKLAENFVFIASAMLSLCTSEWRIEAVGNDVTQSNHHESLLNFCEQGFLANLD